MFIKQEIKVSLFDILGELKMEEPEIDDIGSDFEDELDLGEEHGFDDEYGDY